MKTTLTVNTNQQASPGAGVSKPTVTGGALQGKSDLPAGEVALCNSRTRAHAAPNRVSPSVDVLPKGFPEFPEIKARRDAPLTLRATSGAASVLRQRASMIDERVAAIEARLKEINQRLSALSCEPAAFEI